MTRTASAALAQHNPPPLPTTLPVQHVAAIWPHIRPVSGRVVYLEELAGTLCEELLALWKGQLDTSLFDELAHPSVWPALWIMRTIPDAPVINKRMIKHALTETDPVGGTVAALLPLSFLRRHAAFLTARRPDVYVLPELYLGRTCGWLVWSKVRGRGRLYYLRRARA